MKQNDVEKIFEKVGAIIQNSHFVYTSGLHGDKYVNKDAVYPHTQVISMLCWEIAERFSQSKIDVVVGPALGGIIISQWVAHHLSEISQNEVLAVYAEKSENSGFEIRRGYDKLIAGKNILIVEDILTTGGSIKKVADVVKTLHGKIIAIAALCNRGGVTSNALGVDKLESLMNLSFTTYQAHDCPLCKNNVAINTTVGKGKEFSPR